MSQATCGSPHEPARARDDTTAQGWWGHGNDGEATFSSKGDN
jgi:hypothetical protein